MCDVVVFHRLHTNELLMSGSTGSGPARQTRTRTVHTETIYAHCLVVAWCVCVWQPRPSRVHNRLLQGRALIQFVSNVTYGSFHSHLSPLKFLEL